MVELSTLKPPIRRLRHKILYLTAARGYVQILWQDLILIKIAVIAPLGPPFRVNNVPFQLVGRALNLHLLQLDFGVAIVDVLVEEDRAVSPARLLESQALHDNASLVFGPYLLAETRAVDESG